MMSSLNYAGFIKNRFNPKLYRKNFFINLDSSRMKFSNTSFFQKNPKPKQKISPSPLSLTNSTKPIKKKNIFSYSASKKSNSLNNSYLNNSNNYSLNTSKKQNKNKIKKINLTNVNNNSKNNSINKGYLLNNNSFINNNSNNKKKKILSNRSHSLNNSTNLSPYLNKKKTSVSKKNVFVKKSPNSFSKNSIKNTNFFQSKNIFENFKKKKPIEKNFNKFNFKLFNPTQGNNNHQSISTKTFNINPFPKKTVLVIQDKDSNSNLIQSNYKVNETQNQTSITINNNISNNFTLNPNDYIKKDNNNIKNNKKKIKCIHDLSKTGMSGDEKKVNQDTYFIFKNFGNGFDNIYMGVCDGHGYYGHEVSGYIKENLPMDLNHIIKSRKLNLLTDDLSEAITHAFITENNSLLRNKMIDSNLSGSTCISVIYTPLKLIIANIGDSRCILGKLINKQWKHENLSRDHKPTIKEEADRITKKGGRIRPMKDDDGSFIGPLRVYMKDKDMPGLAMTRSFGDYFASTAGTICEPEVTEHYFKEEDKFIILASDGLFEFIESEEIVNIVKDYYLKNDIVGCCEYLYKESCRRWIQEEEDTIDDITIIIVFFE